MPTQDQPPLNILIVGCSIAGPALATFLLLSPSLSVSQKPAITIIERAPSLRPHGQNVDIRGAGLTLLRKLGLETLVRGSTTGEEGVQWVGPDDAVWASLAAGQSADKNGRTTSTPTADVEILRGRLAELLYKRCVGVSEEVKAQGGKGVEFVFGNTLDCIEQDGDGVNVHFSQGFEESDRRKRFDLVVGADGLQSSTRRLVWGEENENSRLHKLNFYGAFFSIPKGPTDTMWRRWYHAPGRRGIMVRPDLQGGRTTVFLGVMNETDHRFSYVCWGSGNKKRTRGGTSVQAQKELIREYFQDAGWESERVLKGMMETEDFYYDMLAQVRMEHFSKGQVVLLGDAGYVLPLRFFFVMIYDALNLA